MKCLSHKITVLLILFSSCWPQYTFSQDSLEENPRNYLYSNKTVVWEDHFNDDHNEWLIREDSIAEQKDYATIADGYLKYKNTDLKQIYAAGVDPKIDLSRDFEIEYLAKIISAPRKNIVASVLFWSRDSINHTCYLYYCRSGKFVYLALDAKNKTKLNVTRYSRHIRKEDFNKITIRKTGGEIYLFINEHLKSTLKYVPLPGKLIGLGAGPNAEVWYDYIRISYLGS